MVRVKNGQQRAKRHAKYLAKAKGFRLGRKNVYKQVRSALVKQGQHAYVSRKLRKRDFRRLWIERLSAALRTKGIKYSRFVNMLEQKDVLLNRKVLSNISLAFPAVFDVVCDEVLK